MTAHTLPIALGIATCWCALSLNASAQETDIASTRLDGTQGNGQSREPSVSADGRFVCFESRATNLVPQDTNGKWDVFVKDMLEGTTVRASVSSEGVEGNDFSHMTVISDDGTAVGFMSAATNLVPNDTNDGWDFFVHDLITKQTTRINVNSQGEQDNQGADCDGCRVYKGPSLSKDGRYVAFHSGGTNLVDDDTNGFFDIFRHDRVTGETIRVSLNTQGEQANSECWLRDMSPDGRFIVFHSAATNLVPDDNNDNRDIFLHDVETGVTERISISSEGNEADNINDSPRVSDNGRFVTFASRASNLVDDDTNDDWDVFVRDRQVERTWRVSVNSLGEQGDSFARHPSISGNGRWITFHSVSTNLVDDDTNGERDIFLHDSWLSETVRVSVAGDGSQANRKSYDGFISANGRWVVYDSFASNLETNSNNYTTRGIYRSDRFGERLKLAGPTPGLVDGPNIWNVVGANPGSTVTLYYSRNVGKYALNGCGVDLDLQNPGVIGKNIVSANGKTVFMRMTPALALGKTIYFQVYESVSCRKSSRLQFTFDN